MQQLQYLYSMKLVYQKAKVIMMFDWKPSKTNKQTNNNTKTKMTCKNAFITEVAFFSHLYYYITQSHDTHIEYSPDYHSTETRKTDS